MRSTLLVSVALLTLAAPASALTGHENVDALKAKLDRYQTLAQSSEPKERKEAQDILDYFKKLVRMPVYMGGARYNHDPKMGDETLLTNQVNYIKLLLGSMVNAQLTALGFGSPYSDLQRADIKQIYMGDRATVMKLLDSMQRSLAAPVPQKPAAAQAKPAAAPTPKAEPPQFRPRPQADTKVAPVEQPATKPGTDLGGETPQMLR
jgi:hypothetical protein